MRIEYHRTLIADGVRHAAFEAALRQVVKKGESVVADLGAGTGLLGLIAARLGAREVHLYEVGAVAGVALEILKCNGARNCHLMPCHSTEMQDPPRVDVVVSETLGNYPFEENIIDTLNDALKRHLKPGGVVIPARLVQFVAPVITDRFHVELTVWDRTGLGFDFSPARTMSLNNIYVRQVHVSDLLDEGRAANSWDEIDFSVQNRSSRKGQARWRLEQPVTVYGFATWWMAGLAPGVSVSTAPDAPRTHWEQLYFPLLRPIAGRTGEAIVVSLRSRSSITAGTHVGWTATLLDESGRALDRQAMDLDQGYLP
ncbi:MAG TPA: 50S ribosomal protein L11 methyltransferase [Hyphomicrobiaceae bacterium]|nr:50S ribosomal protein L11 methyltransferase [Hyphomicrobiaceae bacterium]